MNQSWAWWHTAIILALQRLRQEYWKFKASWGYIARFNLQNIIIITIKWINKQVLCFILWAHSQVILLCIYKYSKIPKKIWNPKLFSCLTVWIRDTQSIIICVILFESALKLLFNLLLFIHHPPPTHLFICWLVGVLR